MPNYNFEQLYFVEGEPVGYTGENNGQFCFLKITDRSSFCLSAEDAAVVISTSAIKPQPEAPAPAPRKGK